MQLSHRMAAVLCNCCWKQPRCRIEFPSLCCTTSPSTILGVQNQEFLFNKTKNGPTRSQPAVKSNHLVLILVTPFRLVLSAFVDFTLQEYLFSNRMENNKSHLKKKNSSNTHKTKTTLNQNGKFEFNYETFENERLKCVFFFFLMLPRQIPNTFTV